MNEFNTVQERAVAGLPTIWTPKQGEIEAIINLIAHQREIARQREITQQHDIARQYDIAYQREINRKNAHHITKGRFFINTDGSYCY